MSRVGEPRLVRSIRSVISSLWLSGMDCSCSRHQLGFRGDQQNQEIKLGTKFYKANAQRTDLGDSPGFTAGHGQRPSKMHLTHARSMFRSGL
jgi:hypothetical protein